MIQDNYCILAIFFVSLHCVRRKAALPFIKNGKWEINHKKTEREKDRAAHLPYLYQNVEPQKKKGKKKMKKEVWKTILQMLIAVLTAIGTTLGVTSCM